MEGKVSGAPMATSKKVLVCFHDKCFDGASSAAFFTRLYHARIDPDAEITYRGLAHRAGQLFDEDMFTGDENAIVDFKYSSSRRLTWWFDHHQSAFLSEADAQHFRREQNGGRKFYNPDFRSCTKLIAHVAETRFGFHPTDLDNLVSWADLIDGALYPDAKAAVEMKDPATQITLVIEGARDPDFIRWLISELASNTLEAIAALPAVHQQFVRLYAQHLKWMEVVRERAELKEGVLYFDVVDETREGFNKFIPYYLFPEAVYTVSLSRSPDRIKIAVGSSPWNTASKPVNLATICERFGGGGHAKVAAISLRCGELEDARRMAQQIVNELRSSMSL